MNPFHFGQIVTGDEFCGRSVLIKQLRDNIRSGQNTYVQGDRRIGKSSLIAEALRRSRGCRFILTDLMAAKTADDIGREIVRGIGAMDRRNGFIERAIKLLSNFRPGVSFDQMTQSFSLTVNPAVRFDSESLEELLAIVGHLGEGRKMAVVMDEFQDVMGIPDADRVLAAMRGRIQRQSSIAYVFAGSVRDRMELAFTSPDSPFFKSAVPIQVGPLESAVFEKYLMARFAGGKRELEPGLFGEISRIAMDNPGDIQQLCRALWDVSEPGQAIGPGHMAEALQVIFAQEYKGYELALESVSEQQLRCLVALARIGGRQVTSKRFIEASSIQLPGSIKRAFSQLVTKRIVYRSENEYRFFNPYFGTWLLMKRG